MQLLDLLSDPSLPYSWKQTLAEVSVTIKLDKKVRGRDLLVEVKKNHLQVKYKNSDSFIVNGELSKPVKGDILWSLGKEKS